MTFIEPPYTLLDRESHQWRFQESQSIAQATQGFDRLLEQFRYSPKLALRLRKFLQKHPNHIDALHHYAACLLDEGNDLEALAFSQTAVATGFRAFPKQFVIGKDRLSTGFVQNRPFLRALHGLMLAQRKNGLLEDAVTTGQMCLALDHEDRMGARLSLACYLVESGRDKTFLELLDNPAYEGTFGLVGFLRPLALIRLGREEESRGILRDWLQVSPDIARYILHPKLPQPAELRHSSVESNQGENRSWMIAREFGQLWRKNRKAIKLLREESRQKTS